MTLILAALAALSILAAITALVGLLLDHLGTEHAAEQYARCWDNDVARARSATPLYDAIALKYAQRDLTDESLRRWVGDGR